MPCAGCADNWAGKANANAAAVGRARPRVQPQNRPREWVNFDAFALLRNFDANGFVLTFTGDQFEVLPVENAVNELKQKIAGLLGGPPGR